MTSTESADPSSSPALHGAASSSPPLSSSSVLQTCMRGTSGPTDFSTTHYLAAVNPEAYACITALGLFPWLSGGRPAASSPPHREGEGARHSLHLQAFPEGKGGTITMDNNTINHTADHLQFGSTRVSFSPPLLLPSLYHSHPSFPAPRRDYSPLLAGTYPIGLAKPNYASDLDVVLTCEYEGFAALLLTVVECLAVALTTHHEQELGGGEDEGSSAATPLAILVRQGDGSMPLLNCPAPPHPVSSPLHTACAHVEGGSITAAHSTFMNTPPFALLEYRVDMCGGRPSLSIDFTFGQFPFGLFAQDVPSAQQNAYRHLLIEHRLLALASKRETRLDISPPPMAPSLSVPTAAPPLPSSPPSSCLSFRHRIEHLRFAEHLKTEPAFVKGLNLMAYCGAMVTTGCRYDKTGDSVASAEEGPDPCLTCGSAEAMSRIVGYHDTFADTPRQAAPLDPYAALLLLEGWCDDCLGRLLWAAAVH